MRDLPTMLLCLAILAALGAGPESENEPTAEELQANRKRYAEEAKSDPRKFALLRNDGLAFLALPPQRREQIIKLDKQIRTEKAADQARLLGTLQRYNEWFEQLSADDQRRIREAPNKEARLAIIQQLRHSQWLGTQPKALQEQANNLSGEQRLLFIRKARAQERQRVADWQLASRFWRELDEKIPLPARLDDFDHVAFPISKKLKGEDLKIPTYVREYLMPMLSPEEKDRLAKAEGKWPEFPQTLVELADKHPPALRGPYGPKTFAELPKDVQNLTDIKKKLSSKSLASGEWPRFAIAFSNMCYEKNIVLPNELWVSSENGLRPEMRDFIKHRLLVVITKEEETQLFQTTKWPDYPNMIQKLADKYHLDPPWFTLPGPRAYWDRYRTKPASPSYPELSDELLREFVQKGFKNIDEEKRARLREDLDKPEVRQFLTDLYFKRNPMDINRLRQIELRKRLMKKP
jgi:hypothetical protein